MWSRKEVSLDFKEHFSFYASLNCCVWIAVFWTVCWWSDELGNEAPIAHKLTTRPESLVVKYHEKIRRKGLQTDKHEHEPLAKRCSLNCTSAHHHKIIIHDVWLIYNLCIHCWSNQVSRKKTDAWTIWQHDKEEFHVVDAIVVKYYEKLNFSKDRFRIWPKKISGFIP